MEWFTTLSINNVTLHCISDHKGHNVNEIATNWSIVLRCLLVNIWGHFRTSLYRAFLDVTWDCLLTSWQDIVSCGITYIFFCLCVTMLQSAGCVKKGIRPRHNFCVTVSLSDLIPLKRCLNQTSSKYSHVLWVWKSCRSERLNYLMFGRNRNKGLYQLSLIFASIN